MASHRDRSCFGPGHSSCIDTLYRDIQMPIGQMMKWQYELPDELPDRLLALLKQVIEHEDG
jgi:hypothetical protein